MPLMLSMILVALSVAVQQPAPGKTESLEAEAVAADSTNKTLTVKAETGNRTLRVDPKALTALRSVKAGDQVRLTVTDDTVTEIQPAEKPAEPPPQPWDGRPTPPPSSREMP